MSALCTICASEKRAELDAALQAGKSGRSMAAELNLSLAAVYRHIRSGHALPPQSAALAPQTQNGAPQGSALMPSISATLRDVQRLAKEAQRHLRDARKSDDLKATNGAITAASKALELVAKLRGELQSGTRVDVSVSNETRVAMAAHAQALELDPRDQIEAARTLLAAYLEAGDAHAVSAVGELLRMLPSADASTQPQALTPTSALVGERVIPEGGG